MGVRETLDLFRSGQIDGDEAERRLRMDHLDSVGSDVLFDSSRELRRNVPEVVYGLTKTPETVAGILSKEHDGIVLVSKASEEHYEAVLKVRPDAQFDERARIISVGKAPEKDCGTIGIITAGTSDIPIAEEARHMAEAMGVKCLTFYDIGVAGIHRLLGPMKEMISADVSAIVAVAGMEGALPTVVSSLSHVPVIGVPASTGYGIGGKGEAALLSMLQSCSMGLTVVNIDNGIGAGATAAMIAKQRRS